MSVPSIPPFVSEEPPEPVFICGICYEWHENLPLSYSAKVPSAAASIPEPALDRRVIFTLDQCVIDNRDFFYEGISMQRARYRC